LGAGIRQRVAFATATLHKPGVLFLDEPTSGVDPTARQAFWDLVYGFAASGSAVLVSTHYMEESEQADKVVMLSHGKLVTYGSPSELKAAHGGSLEEVFRWAAKC
jgi:ABC-2 type transport system ATP-binding protein